VVHLYSNNVTHTSLYYFYNIASLLTFTRIHAISSWIVARFSLLCITWTATLILPDWTTYLILLLDWLNTCPFIWVVYPYRYWATHHLWPMIQLHCSIMINLN